MSIYGMGKVHQAMKVLIKRPLRELLRRVDDNLPEPTVENVEHFS